nr:hypothetical protein Iba_chr02cCG8400 [Ipomoea batatas]
MRKSGDTTPHMRTAKIKNLASCHPSAMQNCPCLFRGRLLELDSSSIYHIYLSFGAACGGMTTSNVLLVTNGTDDMIIICSSEPATGSVISTSTPISFCSNSIMPSGSPIIVSTLSTGHRIRKTRSSPAINCALSVKGPPPDSMEYPEVREELLLPRELLKPPDNLEPKLGPSTDALRPKLFMGGTKSSFGGKNRSGECAPAMEMTAITVLALPQA